MDIICLYFVAYHKNLSKAAPVLTAAIYTRVFSSLIISISCAPAALSSSIATAARSDSTIACTATHPSSSRLLIVGARFPGVIL